MAATISRIAPEVPVRDLRQSIEYYEQRLGFEPVTELPDHEYAIVERDGVAIHLFQDAAHTPVALHIFTADLEELQRELLSRGAQVTQQIERKPWGNRDFRVRDASGNELKFTEGVV